MYPMPCTPVPPKPRAHALKARYPHSRNHVPQAHNYVPSTLDSMYFYLKFDKKKWHNPQQCLKIK